MAPAQRSHGYGSTQNFINTNVAATVGLLFTNYPAIRVVVANDNKVPCSGRALDVDMHVGPDVFPITCYTIPLGGYDLVLDVTFLRALGPIIWNLDDHWMAFWRSGRRI